MTRSSRIQSKIAILVMSAFSSLAFAADPVGPAREKDHPTSIPLWANGAPSSEAKKDQPEKITIRTEPTVTFAVVSNIHNPTITPYIPAKAKATGAAVIIAPGGGHQFLTTDREGYDVGQWLADRGVAGFVLKYRLARDSAGPSGYKVEVEALADAHRAIRTVRSRAAEWGINPKAVGIMGFSAGGQVAGLAGTKYDPGKPDAADPIDRMNCKPDFQVLIYPGLAGVEITKDTPPTFMLAANNDRLSEGVASLYLTLRKNNVPAELHVYAHGGHGFGLRDKPDPVFDWPVQLHAWMDDMGFLMKAEAAGK